MLKTTLQKSKIHYFQFVIDLIFFIHLLIKIMLKGRKYSDTYLATICKHHWSAQMTMKKDNKVELSASTVAFIS